MIKETVDIHAIPTEVFQKLNPNFVWGCATASYQVEGAFDEDGRTPSIWDVYAKIEGKVDDGSNGDVAVDQYHRYKEDAKLLKKMGAKAYRMSLSWSRILPQGMKDTPVNPLAIAHYRDVFTTLLENGIVPWVTLYHWDLPQVLEDAYGGLLCAERLVPDFDYYARVCFREFGDLVKNWGTFNEPHTFCKLGYGYNGPHAPGRTDDRTRSAEGNPGIEVWKTGHTVLLAHGKAVESYRKLFKPTQNGRISIALNSDWFEPLTNEPKDVDAASRRVDFMLGWFADPIYKTGDYPASMRAQLGDRLPTFTKEESEMILGSADYFGLNSYTSMYVKDSGLDVAPYNDLDGNNIATEFDSNGDIIGNPTAAFWLFDCPWGFKKLLIHIKDRYNNPEVTVLENGCSTLGENDLATEIHDQTRVHFYKGYLSSLVDAIVTHGCNITAYFAWSMLDNFEWSRGYSERFGITYVDFKTQQRALKDSAKFIRNFFDQAIKSPTAKKTITTSQTTKVVTDDGITTVTKKTTTRIVTQL
ncbi:glycoside hydrolase family 1 protein [Globomyces pollinis-pini]|nr:glycoside hydrolase family 1 protein [Globomyces pollinis-pini]KAJ2991133.1 hypothetical protein HDV02_003939 [Globomyces sp. JEL0801]